MKKFSTLAAALAFAALGVNAQNTLADASLDAIINNGDIFDVIVINDGAIDQLKAAGKTVNDYRVNDVDRFLYIWDETFTAGDGSYPGPGMHTEGYVSLNVGTVGWSGGGFFEAAGSGVDLSHFTTETRFHVAYRTESNAPASVALMLGNDKDVQAKFALGEAFNDNGVIMPSVGAAFTDEWQALDISLADLKKVWPDFMIGQLALKDYPGLDGRNLVTFLAGGVQGQNICLDQMYFYTKTEGSAVGTIEINEGEVEYFNLQGMKVVNPENGIFVRRQGNKVEKVVL